MASIYTNIHLTYLYKWQFASTNIAKYFQRDGLESISEIGWRKNIDMRDFVSIFPAYYIISAHGKFPLHPRTVIFYTHDCWFGTQPPGNSHN